MFAFFQTVSAILVPIFVISAMFNVGLTQRPTKIVEHLRVNWGFFLRMVVTNLIIVPALMVFALEIFEVSPAYSAGLIIFAVAAGAPFLIKLTALSEHDMALGATTLMVLMAATVALMPFLLPALIEGVQVDAWAVTKALVMQQVAPMILGMLILEFIPKVAAWIQPIVAKVSNLSMWAMIVTIFIGYAPAMLDVELWLALILGVVVLALSFLVGYMMGDGKDQLSDLGGLATAQRGTASAVIVAAQNFEDPVVLVFITILNTVCFVGLIAIAKALSKDNKVSPLTPAAADNPCTDPRITKIPA